MLTSLTEQLKTLHPVLRRFTRLQLRDDSMADAGAQEAHRLTSARLNRPHPPKAKPLDDTWS